MPRSYPNIGAYGPTGTWNRASVLRTWFEEIDTTPVIIISMGDSNSLRALGGNWRINAGAITNEACESGANAFTKVMHERANINGTGIRNTTIQGVYSNGSNSAGNRVSIAASDVLFADAKNKTAPFNAGFTDAYWSVPSPWDPLGPTYFYDPVYPGGMVSGASALNKNHGLILQKDHHFILEGRTITALYKYATFAASGGAFRPTWRTFDGVSTYTNRVINATINSTGADAMVNGTLTITPNLNPNKDRLDFRMDYAGVAPITGLWFCPFIHAVEDRAGGVFHHLLGGMGGQSVYDMAQWTQDMGTTKLTNYITEVIRGVRVANPAATIRIIFRVQSGVNDINETGLSHDGVNTSNTSKGFGSNRYKLFGNLEAAALAAGVSVGDIRYLTELSHRQLDTSTGDQAKLDAFWSGALIDDDDTGDLAVDFGSRIVNANLGALHTAAEFSRYENGYSTSRVLDAGGGITSDTYDKAHLCTWAYRTLYQRLFSSLLGPIFGASYRCTAGEADGAMEYFFF